MAIVQPDCAAPDIRRAEEIRVIIETNPQMKLTIQQLAKRTGTNTSTLKKCFKWRYGISIYQFGLQVRLFEAKRLLKETDKTIQQVAELTGYSEATNLCRIFSQVTGMSPGEWRRINCRKD